MALYNSVKIGIYLRLIFLYLPRYLRANLCYGLNFGFGKNFLGQHSKIFRRSSIYFEGGFKIGDYFAVKSLTKRQIICGKNISIRDNVCFDCVGVVNDLTDGRLTIGDNVGISDRCMFFIRGNLRIGADTIFGPDVKIFTENHVFRKNEFTRLNKCEAFDVEIGQNCWIGANVTILPGVKLGNNCVVGAGSILSGSYDDNSVVFGDKSKTRKTIS